MRKMKAKVKPLTVRKTYYLPATLAAWLDATADADNRSSSKYLALLLARLSTGGDSA